MSTYYENRSLFTEDDLRPYDGLWVAFSDDASRIVASAPDILTLNERVVAAGEDPAEVGTERIVIGATWAGAIEFE